MRQQMLFILGFILTANMGFGQAGKLESNHVGLKKNVVYGTFGVDFTDMYATLEGNYERMIVQFPGSFVQSLWFRIGAGKWVAWAQEGSNYVSTFSAVMGKQSSHLELGAGVLFTYNNYYQRFHPLVNDRHIAGNLGYRYQKPGGYFIFRTGIGWPEFTYISLGCCF